MGSAARAPAAARESWGAADITPFLTIAPPIPAVEAVTDAAPTAAFLEPLAGTVAPVGEPLYVTVKAADDFGVKSVTLSLRAADGPGPRSRACSSGRSFRAPTTPARP